MRPARGSCATRCRYKGGGAPTVVTPSTPWGCCWSRRCCCCCSAALKVSRKLALVGEAGWCCGWRWTVWREPELTLLSWQCSPSGATSVRAQKTACATRRWSVTRQLFSARLLRTVSRSSLPSSSLYPRFILVCLVNDDVHHAAAAAANCNTSLFQTEPSCLDRARTRAWRMTITASAAATIISAEAVDLLPNSIGLIPTSLSASNSHF